MHDPHLIAGLSRGATLFASRADATPSRADAALRRLAAAMLLRLGGWFIALGRAWSEPDPAPRPGGCL